MNGMKRRLTETADGRVNRGITNKELRTTKEENFRSNQHSFEILRFSADNKLSFGLRHSFVLGSCGLRHSPTASSCSIVDCGRP